MFSKRSRKRKALFCAPVAGLLAAVTAGDPAPQRPHVCRLMRHRPLRCSQGHLPPITFAVTHTALVLLLFVLTVICHFQAPNIASSLPSILLRAGGRRVGSAVACGVYEGSKQALGLLHGHVVAVV